MALRLLVFVVVPLLVGSVYLLGVLHGNNHAVNELCRYPMVRASAQEVCR